MDDVQIAKATEALSAKRKRDLADPSYNRLNVAKWHQLVGLLSNRVVDFESSYETMSKLINDLNSAAAQSDSAEDSMKILDKIAQLKPQADQYLQEIEDVSEKMNAELEWYTDETTQAAWDAAGVSTN